MPEFRGITISVGYAECLAITLPRNMRHFTECVVVTTPEDKATQEVARSVPGVRVLETDVFTRLGARFNKGWGMELGLDYLGRHGWILIHDADILFPDSMALNGLDTEKLYGMRRRILADPSKWRPDLVWTTCPVHLDGGPIGFAQAAHASASSLRDQKVWYDVSYPHGGGCDDYFMKLFPPSHRHVLPIDVLHLGLCDRHWFGVDQAGIDMMAKFVYENNWHRAQRYHTRESAARAGEVVERVQVPGYEPSTHQLPFVERTKSQRKP